MMQLYNETCFECSKLITNKYSTSFSLGIKAFNKKFHYPIYAIYGFVRYADEIVDTFHDHDKEKLIADFRVKTFEAIASKISLNPVLHSFQTIVNKFNIENNLIEAFLNSMQMDLTHKIYTQEDYQNYIHGSAEVIGLMCLKVFCQGNEQFYNSLDERARSLGSAFQKINFLRDIRSDFEERGRVYFPEVEYHSFNKQDKQKIEADIEKDFEKGLEGIKDLPTEVRTGVYIAYVYYYELFRKIKKVPAEVIVKGRVRVSNKKKIWLLARAILKDKLKAI